MKPGGLKQLRDALIWQSSVAQEGARRLKRVAGRTPERAGEAALHYVPDPDLYFLDRFSPTLSSWNPESNDPNFLSGFMTEQVLAPIKDRYMKTQGPSALAHSHPWGNMPAPSLGDLETLGVWLYEKGKYRTPDLELPIVQSESPNVWSTIGGFQLPYDEAHDIMRLHDAPVSLRRDVQDLGKELRWIDRYHDSDAEYLTTALGARRLRDAGLATGHQSFGAEFNRMIGPQFEELLRSLPPIKRRGSP